MGLCNITEQEAYSIWRDAVNQESTPTASSVYWDALTAEREGLITLAEMDAISVFHKGAIVKRHYDDIAWEQADAKLQSDVHAEQGKYWDDHEAGLLSDAHYC